MKLAINIHYVSGNGSKDFQGQKSKVKVTARSNALFRQRDDYQLINGRPSVDGSAEAYRSTIWRRGWLVKILL